MGLNAPAADAPDMAGGLSLTHEDFLEAVQRLREVDFPIERDPEEAWQEFSGWRVNYEKAAYELARAVSAVRAPWSGPRLHPDPVIYPLRPAPGRPPEKRHRGQTRILSRILGQEPVQLGRGGRGRRSRPGHRDRRRRVGPPGRGGRARASRQRRDEHAGVGVARAGGVHRRGREPRHAGHPGPAWAGRRAGQQAAVRAGADQHAGPAGAPRQRAGGCFRGGLAGQRGGLGRVAGPPVGPARHLVQRRGRDLRAERARVEDQAGRRGQAGQPAEQRGPVGLVRQRVPGQVHGVLRAGGDRGQRGGGQPGFRARAGHERPLAAGLDQGDHEPGVQPGHGRQQHRDALGGQGGPGQIGQRPGAVRAAVRGGHALPGRGGQHVEPAARGDRGRAGQHVAAARRQRGHAEHHVGHDRAQVQQPGPGVRAVTRRPAARAGGPPGAPAPGR